MDTTSQSAPKYNLLNFRHEPTGSTSTKKKTTLFNESNNNKTLSLLLLTFLTTLLYNNQPIECRENYYYYSRTRNDPNHLRVSEEFKNRYVDEVKFVSRINGTRYNYYLSPKTIISSNNHPNNHHAERSQLNFEQEEAESSRQHLKQHLRGQLSHDEMVFETIDKMYQHRLSPFYVHHYDSEQDKRRSFDTRVVSRQACARDLSYLLKKLPSKQATTDHHHHRQVDSKLSSQQEHLTPELMALFDSYGRQEAGLYLGNIYWVGGYDQCINRHIFDLDANDEHTTDDLSNDKRHQSFSPIDDREVINFKGRYCVASIKAPSWDAIITERQKRGSKMFKTQRQKEVYRKLFRLQLGVCLPDSCDSSSIERHQDEIKRLTMAMLDSRYAHYELNDLYCLPDETSPLRSWSGSARNFLIFVGAWLSLIVGATLADLCGINQKSKFVQWMSLIQNFQKIMTVKDQVQAQPNKKQTNQATTTTTTSTGNGTVEPLQLDLRFLNAFKALTMFWIINGHIMLLMIQTAKNILYSDALLNGLMHFLIGATFGVDLFFTMTGFLTSYLLFDTGHARKMRLGTWIYLSFHRYWRLAPMYLMAFWFSRSVAQMLGSGPLWDYGTDSITFRGLCNHESWWYPATLTSNLHGLFEECMITSWYISCDMQFWLVSPIFIHLLAKSPAAGWAASLATILMSCKVRYDNILTEQTARYDELVQPRADIFMRVSHDLPALYTHPHHRIAAYIVGMLAGHYVYMVKSGRWSSSMISLQKQTIMATTQEQQQAAPRCQIASAAGEKQPPALEQDAKSKLAVVHSTSGTKMRSTIGYAGLTFFLVMSFASYILSHYYPVALLKYSKEIASYAYSVDHLLMSVGASFCIVAMCFGQWPKVTQFLSHPNWTRISKINYALLLLQCEAIYYQIFRYDQVPVAGTKELINILFNLLVTLYPVAFFVTLAVEFPLANMEKIWK